MNATLTPPGLPTVLPPFGIERIIYTIQHSLALVPGIQYSLGRIKPQVNEGKIEPWLQIEDSREYYKAYPNDELINFTCLFAHDDETPDDTAILFNRTLSVIAWFNLEKLPDGKTLDSMKRDIYNNLKNLSCIGSFNAIKDQTANGSAGIYPGFDMSAFEGRYLKAPYGAFRIEVTVNYADLCL